MDNFYIGDEVWHEQHGAGKIIEIDDAPDALTYQVEFKQLYGDNSPSSLWLYPNELRKVHAK